MRGRAKTCNVVEGRIRVSCPRCERKWYLAVPAGIRRKSVRCTCGKALLFLASGRQCPVYLCDLSLGGVGFNVPPQYVRALAAGQEGQLKYRAMNGSSMQRRIRIRSVANTRVCAQFLDNRFAAASW